MDKQKIRKEDSGLGKNALESGSVNSGDCITMIDCSYITSKSAELLPLEAASDRTSELKVLDRNHGQLEPKMNMR
jgi:hypothetical protein